MFTCTDKKKYPVNELPSNNKCLVTDSLSPELSHDELEEEEFEGTFYRGCTCCNAHSLCGNYQTNRKKNSTHYLQSKVRVSRAKAAESMSGTTVTCTATIQTMVSLSMVCTPCTLILHVVMMNDSKTITPDGNDDWPSSIEIEGALIV